MPLCARLISASCASPVLSATLNMIWPPTHRLKLPLPSLRAVPTRIATWTSNLLTVHISCTVHVFLCPFVAHNLHELIWWIALFKFPFTHTHVVPLFYRPQPTWPGESCISFLHFQWVSPPTHVAVLFYRLQPTWNPHLVSPAYQVEVVFVQELGDDLGAEGEGHAAVVLAPAHRLLVGVGPQQVAQQPLVRHVRRPHDAPDLLHRL